MEGCRMETIAVYFESKIRTYGFNLKEELLLCELTVSSESVDRWGVELQSLADVSRLFHLIWAIPSRQATIKFCLLCDAAYEEEIQKIADRLKKLNITHDVKYETPVELIFFQGPHFGDRHGIADFTLKALLGKQIPLKAMACSGAAVYLVFSKNWGVKAKAVLSSAFEIPQTKNRS